VTLADNTDLSGARELSQSLFGGARYRIEVGAAIAESDGLVCIVDLARRLGDPPGKGSVNTELKVFERAGLLTRPDKRRGGRVWLLRQKSPFWDMCLKLRNDTASAQGRRRADARNPSARAP
jgi:hypothetical protein